MFKGEENRIAGFMSYLHGSFDAGDEMNRRKLVLAGQLDALAREAEITLAQLSLGFILAHPAITSVIVGPRTLDQLEGLLPAGEIRVEAGILERIDALVPPGSMLSLPLDKTRVER